MGLRFFPAGDAYAELRESINSGITVEERTPASTMGSGSAPAQERTRAEAQTSTWDRFRDLVSHQGQSITYRTGNRTAPPKIPVQTVAPRRFTTGHDFRLVSRKMKVTEDYYMILGVRREATLEELERAYRRYVWKIHPDRFHLDPDKREQCERKLKTINVAMRILRDPSRRAEYDAAWLYA